MYNIKKFINHIKKTITYTRYFNIHIHKYKYVVYDISKIGFNVEMHNKRNHLEKMINKSIIKYKKYMIFDYYNIKNNRITIKNNCLSLHIIGSDICIDKNDDMGYHQNTIIITLEGDVITF